MRRATAFLILILVVFTAAPTYAASLDGGFMDRGFFGRFKQIVVRALHHVVSNGDYLSPPKP
ncbi:MAG TPA: hypothetical protein VF980_03785 [Thermoanaerobaculia bacterium]